MDAIQAVELQIAKVNEEIDALSTEIKEAKEKINHAQAAGNVSEVQRWDKEREQLRKEREQLRKEKEQLRDEKAQLWSAGMCLFFQACLLLCAVALEDCAKQQAGECIKGSEHPFFQPLPAGSISLGQGGAAPASRLDVPLAMLSGVEGSVRLLWILEQHLVMFF
jgi:hypothetical protein